MIVIEKTIYMQLNQALGKRHIPVQLQLSPLHIQESHVLKPNHKLAVCLVAVAPQQSVYPTLQCDADTILKSLNGFIMVIDPNGEVFYVSETVEQYLGFHQVSDQRNYNNPPIWGARLNYHIWCAMRLAACLGWIY